MGTDIHAKFQRRNDRGEWEALWKPEPDATYWWEAILDRKIADHSISLAFGIDPDDEKTQHRVGEQWFKSIPPEEIMDRFGSDPYIVMTWPIPRLSAFSIDCRNYDWFEAIAGLRSIHGPNQFFDTRGVPPVCCPEIAREIKQWEGDGHSHSWLMIDELLDHPAINHSFPKHCAWFREYIKDPKNTMMVFFFDN